MEKTARKALEKQLVTVLHTELKKTNEKATQNVMKHIKDGAKTISKKFAKAVVALQQEKAAAIARQPIPVKTTVAKKVIRKAQRKSPKKVAAKKK